MSWRWLHWDWMWSSFFVLSFQTHRSNCDVFWSVSQRVSGQACISQTFSCWVTLPSLCALVYMCVCLMANEGRFPQSPQRPSRRPLVIILWEAGPDVGTATCNTYTLSRHSVGFSSLLSALSDANTYTAHTRTHCLKAWWDCEFI